MCSFVTKTPMFRSIKCFLGLTVILLLVQHGSTTDHSNLVASEEMYVGLPGKPITLTWTYTGQQMLNYVTINLPVPHNPVQSIMLWRIRNVNKKFIKRKYNVPSSVFNNLTELTREGNSKFLLTVKKVPRNMSSFEFECRVNYEKWKPEIEKKITIRVAAPPVITLIVDKGDDGENVPKGRDIKIICSATGFPSPNIEIKKDSSSLLATKGDKEKEATLSLPNVQPDDSGLYTCVASNRAGVTSKDVYIPIDYIELKQAGFITIQSSIGSSEDLNCPIEGYPQVIFSWYKDNDLRTSQLARYKELTVKLENEEQFGNYTCKGQNHAGTRVVTFSIVGTHHNFAGNINSATASERNSAGNRSASTRFSFALGLLLMLVTFCFRRE